MATDAEIRDVISRTPTSVLDHLIGEYIHDARNQEIARRKILRNERFEPLSEAFGLTSKQCRNIIRQARRTIFEHL